MPFNASPYGSWDNIMERHPATSWKIHGIPWKLIIMLTCRLLIMMIVMLISYNLMMIQTRILCREPGFTRQMEELFQPGYHSINLNRLVCVENQDSHLRLG